jgi:hypothetical protein
MGALLNVKIAPSSWHFRATCQAIDFSSNAPKIIPLLPFKRLYAMYRCFEALKLDKMIDLLHQFYMNPGFVSDSFF